MINVVANFKLRKEDEAKYIEAVKKDVRAHGENEDAIAQITLKSTDDGNVEVEYLMGKKPGFERIRRITGYLVGTVDRWNDAKKAELNDRVKHA